MRNFADISTLTFLSRGITGLPVVLSEFNAVSFFSEQKLISLVTPTTLLHLPDFLCSFTTKLSKFNAISLMISPSSS